MKLLASDFINPPFFLFKPAKERLVALKKPVKSVETLELKTEELQISLSEEILQR